MAGPEVFQCDDAFSRPQPTAHAHVAGGPRKAQRGLVRLSCCTLLSEASPSANDAMYAGTLHVCAMMLLLLLLLRVCRVEQQCNAHLPGPSTTLTLNPEP
eukprot:3899106-Pyramimonas_sp.AAC.1